MKIALFDRINEGHVCLALEEALRRDGHEVVTTGRVGSGHRFAQTPEQRQAIDAAFERIMSSGCDLLLNFRASSLEASQIDRIRALGVTTAVWLPDDVVLYEMTYRHIVDRYDIVLHCGSGRSLEFYDGCGHRAGVNFPFWVDPVRWPYRYAPGDADRDLVFIGNLLGSAGKKVRYERLRALSGHLQIYGKCEGDPLGMCRGELVGVEALAAVLPCYRLGLNLPQRFADYAGTEYDFPGLAELGSFDLPSRVTQYAAIGLPVVTLSSDATRHFPAALTTVDVDEIRAMLANLAQHQEALNSASVEGRRLVERHFSAEARARFLLALVQGEVQPARLSASDREFAYRWFPGEVSA